MAGERLRCTTCGRPVARESDSSSTAGLCWADPGAVVRTQGADERFTIQCGRPKLERVFELESLLARVRDTAETAAREAYALPSDAEAAADLYAALDEIVAMIAAASPGSERHGG